MSTYRAYSSANYTVFSRAEGVEILNIPSNATQWLQGDDATDALGGIETIPARVPAEKVESATDHYLSQWFGGDVQ